MIGYFPEPYPDELFYSLAARFVDRTRLPANTGVMESLFGRPHAVAIVDLPHGLEALVIRLPPGHPCTLDGLIDDHTLLPYYGPFLATKTYEKVRAITKSGRDASVRVRCGICTNRVGLVGRV